MKTDFFLYALFVSGPLLIPSPDNFPYNIAELDFWDKKWQENISDFVTKLNVESITLHESNVEIGWANTQGGK